MPELLVRIYTFFLQWFVPGPTPEPAPLPDPDPQPPPIPIPPSPESLVIAAINSERRANGLARLAADDLLDRMAHSWAHAMATSAGLDHGNFAGRMGSIYPNTLAAENIAEGQPDAGSVVAAWMDDPPHRANILGDFNRVGVGFERDEAGAIYWCADFASV